MISEEKINAVKSQLKRGQPPGEIKEELIAEGYSKEDIEKCFEVHKSDMRSWYLFFAIAFLLGGFWAYYYSSSLLLFVAAAVMYSLYYSAGKKK